ncbi:MAG: hypothetical protein ACOC5T_04750 [Elusimicrobiota bacterium]
MLSKTRFDGSIGEDSRKNLKLVVFGRIEDNISYNLQKSLKSFFISIKEDLGFLPSINLIKRPEPEISNLQNSGVMLNGELSKIHGKIVLGVTDLGIYDDFVQRNIFGYGGNGTGLLSTYRFRQREDGMEKLKERLCKEIIKILGLACGISCNEKYCILTYHRFVVDLDVNNDVCPNCREKMIREIKYYMEVDDEQSE